jgi:hypothetical protein
MTSVASEEMAPVVHGEKEWNFLLSLPQPGMTQEDVTYAIQALNDLSCDRSFPSFRGQELKDAVARLEEESLRIKARNKAKNQARKESLKLKKKKKKERDRIAAERAMEEKRKADEKRKEVEARVAKLLAERERAEAEQQKKAEEELEQQKQLERAERQKIIEEKMKRVLGDQKENQAKSTTEGPKKFCRYCKDYGHTMKTDDGSTTTCPTLFAKEEEERLEMARYGNIKKGRGALMRPQEETVQADNEGAGPSPAQNVPLLTSMSLDEFKDLCNDMECA